MNLNQKRRDAAPTKELLTVEKQRTVSSQVFFKDISVAMLLSGAILYFLGVRLGHFRNEWPILEMGAVLDFLWADGYIINAAVAVAVALVLYQCMSWCAAKKKLAIILGTLLFFWNVFLGGMCIAHSVKEDTIQPVYEGKEIVWQVDQLEEIGVLRSKCKFIGRGEQYYTYANYDEIIIENYDAEENERIRKNAEDERVKAGIAFSEWESEAILPVLSYCYGFWIYALYGVLSVAWMVSAFLCGMAVKGKGQKALYGSCFLLLSVLLIGPSVAFWGIAGWTLPVVFSTSDLPAMIACSIVPLVAMYFHVQGSSTES